MVSILVKFSIWIMSGPASCKVRRAVPFSLLLFTVAACIHTGCRTDRIGFRETPRPRLHRPWNQDLIYFALIDRFMDGDPFNNVPSGSDPSLYDPAQKDLKRYHGGDLRGLELALMEGYFNDLGVTAIWISPPVRNAWYSELEEVTGYHGYWAQDFLDIDPHWTSRFSLSGRPYPDGREGRLAHYRDFIHLAHSRGIRVVQDVVLNHIGPLFYYDLNRNGQLDRDATRRPLDHPEWVAPFNGKEVYSDTVWLKESRWNLQPIRPDGPLILDLPGLNGLSVGTTGLLRRFDVYGRHGFSPGSLGKSDGEEILCDFYSLRDLNTDPSSPHFQALVDEFAEIYAFYINVLGVDGLRLDTVRHVHHGFWDAFMDALYERLEPDAARSILVFGEVYSRDPSELGKYTWRADHGAGSTIQSMLNFPFCFNLRNYLRVRENGYGKFYEQAESDRLSHALEIQPSKPDSQTRPIYNPRPQPDGFGSAQKRVNFVENHDGLNRFRAAGVSVENNALASGLALLSEGIPCLYYGVEAALEAPDPPERESESGRMTFIPRGETDSFRALRSEPTFRFLAGLAQLRAGNPALQSGETVVLWEDRAGLDSDDGLLVFSRWLKGPEGGVVVVACNAHPTQAALAGTAARGMPLLAGDGTALLERGDRLRLLTFDNDFAPVISPEFIAPVWVEGHPEVKILVPPKGLVLYQAVSGP